jgi:ADP-dependent NAD(P)H-hydrate dehydratase
MAEPGARPLTLETLRGWPLPSPATGGDKEAKGRALIIAGSRRLGGVAALCATAALRAGAGKVTIATAQSTAGLTAIAMPECKVIGLPESGLGMRASPELAELGQFNSVLIGCGMEDEASVLQLVRDAVPRLRYQHLILDAYAMGAVAGLQTGGPTDERATLITPHPGEMAHLRNIDKDLVLQNALAQASSAATGYGALVALKSAHTYLASPSGEAWHYDGSGHLGLGVSGSGDVLAGLITGFAARSSNLMQAAAWGVVMHGQAASRLEQRTGSTGYLARELAAEVPPLLTGLSGGAPGDAENHWKRLENLQ